jgi:hypothetical protein
MDMEGILAVILIFGGGTLFLLSLSPVGKAFAERLRGHAAHDPELLAENKSNNNWSCVIRTASEKMAQMLHAYTRYPCHLERMVY